MSRLAMAARAPATMRAVVCNSTGPTSVLKIQQVPVPTPKDDQVLVKVLAFGINRAEMYTRQGHSPGVTFPRILGIELIGTIAGYPAGAGSNAGDLPIGTKIATCMGGLGREIPGSYAEYACPWKSNVRAIPQTSLPIAKIAALPELLQTAYGSLVEGLDFKRGDSILVRGATSSVGLTALQLARYLGAGRVAGTSRSKSREELLRGLGADEVYVDDGNIAGQISEEKKFNKILELVGATTLSDSARCLRPKGMVCMTGIQGGEWVVKDFSPMADLDGRKRLTCYGGGPADFLALPWEELLKAVEDGKIDIPTKEYGLEQIQEVHELLESGGGGQKLVVVL